MHRRRESAHTEIKTTSESKRNRKMTTRLNPALGENNAREKVLMTGRHVPFSGSAKKVHKKAGCYWTLLHATGQQKTRKAL